MSISSEFCFKMIHSKNLIYNTCWEDPRLDRQALELGPRDEVMVITSAGCNALDYVLAGARQVHAVDLNPRQNALLELKLAAIKALRYSTFFKMFGKGYLPHLAHNYRFKLRPLLSEPAQRVWDRDIWMFAGYGWRDSFYFRGSSGFFARLINTYIDRGAKIRRPLEELLESDDVSAQNELFEQIFPKLWRPLVRWFVDRDLSLALLGVPPAQRQQVERFYRGGIGEFIENCLRDVFTALPIKDNYFWRVYITGEYTETCCPEYLQYENFEKLKNGLADRIKLYTCSVTDFLRSRTQPINKFVLLDHMDWLSTRGTALGAELEQVLDKAAPGARMIWRSGGLHTEFVDQTKIRRDGGTFRMGEFLSYKKELANSLHKQDRVHTYGSFYIADLLAA